MSSDHQETQQYLYRLIDSGSRSFQSLTKLERRKLIAVYLPELDRIDSIFEDKEPSRFLISSFIDNPKSKEYRARMIDEITDCAFSAHESRLEAMFDEAYEKFMGDCVHELCEFDEHRAADNRERIADMRAA